MAAKITINPVASPAANTPFTVSGSLSHDFQYQDGSGSPVTFAGPPLTWTMTHPGLPAGAQTITVSDTVSGVAGSVAVTVSAASGLTESPSGTIVTPTNGGSIILADGKTKVTLANGQVVFNGTPDAKTKNVGLLHYWSHTLRQQDSVLKGWWPWTGTAWGAQMTASGSGAEVKDEAGVILNAAGDLVTLKDGKVWWNGVADAKTANVTEVLYYSGTVYQQAAAGWWPWTGTAWGAQMTADPRTTPTASGRYAVSNGALRDPSGNVFYARGVNVSWNAPWGGHSFTNVASTNLLSFSPKLNFVRFNNWAGGLCDPASSQIQNWVQDLTSHGIVVCFDLHYTGNAISPNDGTANGWLAACAKQYMNNPMVWYQTQNEPQGGGQAVSAMMKGQHDAVRGTGNTAPVILCVGSLDMNGANISPLSNVVWDPHYYPAAGTDWHSYLNGLGLSRFTSKDGFIPSMVIEFGDSTDGQNIDGNWQYYINQTTNPSTGPVNGYAAWVWNSFYSQGPGMADCILAGNLDGSQRTAYGQLLADNMNKF